MVDSLGKCCINKILYSSNNNNVLSKYVANESKKEIFRLVIMSTLKKSYSTNSDTKTQLRHTQSFINPKSKMRLMAKK